jgi:hypothetical protein
VFSRLTLTHDGERNIIVRELFGRGLVNDIGGYEGTVRLGPDGLFGLEISAAARPSPSRTGLGHVKSRWEEVTPRPCSYGGCA